MTTSLSGIERAPAVGLSAAAATQRLRNDGPNAVESAPARRVGGRIVRQLADPLVALLLVAAVVTTALGDYADTAVIALVVLVNTTIGVWQEIRADRAIAALDRLAAPTARVVRDGVDRVVPASEVVRGDRLRLTAGDIVPADLALDDAYRLRLDESAMTGEAHPVRRSTGEEAFAGTVVLTGRGAGTVVRVGASSALGRVVSLVRSTRPGPTPLQRRLATLGRMLGAIAVVTSAAVFGLGVATGRGVVEMAITAVSWWSRPCRSRCRPSSRWRWPSAPGAWRGPTPSPAACSRSRRWARSP
ncbi:cation-transporting P-type ATPase [Asanoa sp. NPDC049518]|uniref:P-type ATPase n=1 Tax=unclassified Asanoa TaxID=2685164 RepID=UPI00344494AF